MAAVYKPARQAQVRTEKTGSEREREREEGGSLGDVRPESKSASSFGSVIKKRINERQTRTLLRVPQQLASSRKVCSAADAQEGAERGRRVPLIDSLSLRIRLQLRELWAQFTADCPKIPPSHFSCRLRTFAAACRVNAEEEGKGGTVS